MEILYELANFFNKSISKAKPLGIRSWKRDKSDVFYEKLINREFVDDNEAANFFYNTKDHRYVELKMRTLNNLITSVLLLDFNGKDLHPYSKKYYSMLREMAVANILFANSLHSSAIYIAKRCYNKAQQIGYYDILYSSVRILKRHYGATMLDNVKYIKYNERLEEIKRILSLEDKADNYYSELLILHKRKKASLEQIEEKASLYFSELSPYLQSCKSMRFQLMTRLIRTIVNAAKSDFHLMFSDSNNDVEYFRDNHDSYYTYMSIFLYQKTIACIRLGKYKQGLSTINQTLSLINERSTNWFPFNYHRFFIYMQSGNYSEAQRLYLRVTNHRRYKTLVPHMKEDWIVGGAYLNYIIEKGELESHNKFKFRIGKFINEVPEYSKDRRVKNIPILIAQIIFMIYRKQTGKVIDRMDAIKQYCGRNLRYNEAVRSNSFIMALMEIPKQSFNRIAVERHITRFTKRLEEVPLHLSGKNFDLEIIPYERLLGYVLEDL